MAIDGPQVRLAGYLLLCAIIIALLAIVIWLATRNLQVVQVAGISGASGVSGIPGQVAFSGVSGVSGQSGPSGAPGSVGPSGAKGASGPSGASGIETIAYSQAKDTTTGTTITGGAGVSNITNLSVKKSNNLPYNAGTGVWTIVSPGMYTMTATVFTTSNPGTATLSFAWSSGTESVTTPFTPASGGSIYYATVTATGFNAAAATLAVFVLNSTTATFYTSNASVTFVSSP